MHSSPCVAPWSVIKQKKGFLFFVSPPPPFFFLSFWFFFFYARGSAVPPTTPTPAPLRQWRGRKAAAEKEARFYSTVLWGRAGYKRRDQCAQFVCAAAGGRCVCLLLAGWRKVAKREWVSSAANSQLHALFNPRQKFQLFTHFFPRTYLRWHVCLFSGHRLLIHSFFIDSFHYWRLFWFLFFIFLIYFFFDVLIFYPWISVCA